MKHTTSIPRQQRVLFPESLDESIVDDNPVWGNRTPGSVRRRLGNWPSSRDGMALAKGAAQLAMVYNRAGSGQPVYRTSRIEKYWREES